MSIDLLKKEKIDAVFGAEHQRVNDQRVAIMIDEIMAGMYEIYDGSIELEDNPEIVEELLKKISSHNSNFGHYHFGSRR